MKWASLRNTRTPPPHPPTSRNPWLLICQLPDNYCRTALSSDWNRLLHWCAAVQPRKTISSGTGIPRCPGWISYPGNGSGHAGWCRGRKAQSSCSMKEIAELDWTPGVESEPLPNLRLKSIALAVLASFGLFCLLPLSEFVRPEEWIVRPAEVPTYTPPPPPATEMEKRWSKSWIFLPPPWKLHPCNC